MLRFKSILSLLPHSAVASAADTADKDSVCMAVGNTHVAVNNRIKRYLSIAVIALFFEIEATSCDVHEFPDSTEESTVTVNMRYAGSMPVYIDYTRTDSVPDEYDTRYIVEFHRYVTRESFSENPVKRIVITREEAESLDYSITTTLPKGTYKVLAWTDYVERGSMDDKFYLTTSLANDVELIENMDNACNDHRDAFYGALTETVENDSEVFDIDMIRPMAKFIFIANDFQKLVEKSIATKGDDGSSANNQDTYSIKFYYTGYMPSAYSVVYNYNIDAITGVNFNNTVTSSSGTTSDDSVELGYDYVFVNPTGGSLDVMLVIDDSKGEEIGRTSKIKVPLMQGQITIVRCSLEQDNAENNGGAGIDPDFEGPDYNLHL